MNFLARPPLIRLEKKVGWTTPTHSSGKILFCLISFWSGYPVRQHRQGVIGLFGIITGQVDTEVMLAAHVAMHQEFHGEIGALTGLEYHRTDGRNRRSTPFDDINIGLFFETEGLVPNIRNFEAHLNRLAQFYFAQVNLLFIHLHSGGAIHLDRSLGPTVPAFQSQDSQHQQRQATKS
jgi:hypothetical protein